MPTGAFVSGSITVDTDAVYISQKITNATIIQDVFLCCPGKGVNGQVAYRHFCSGEKRTATQAVACGTCRIPNPECAHRRFGNESAEANTLKGNPGAASNVFINALKAY